MNAVIAQYFKISYGNKEVMTKKQTTRRDPKATSCL